MYRKPVFWIVLVLVAALSIWYTVANFSRAYPLVTLDLAMDREAALEAARDLAESRGWGPEGYRQAAAFALDSQLQAFVELEAGGRDRFTSMLSEGLISPYTWRVRNFKEAETTETLVRFTPAGRPYGFVETLPEDQPGAALEPEEARQIAVGAATGEWGVDLERFESVEESQEVRPGGRVDHTFVYERPSLMVGDQGRYRLRLVVSGDRFTELTHFVKIPEAFERRYEKMRSANDSIAFGATGAVALLYVIGGCFAGLFLLLRERRVLWKSAMKWAVFIAVVQVAVSLNQWPLSWMGYDTALSATNFSLQQIVMTLVQGFGMGALFAITVIAAESLSRKAFPHHIQLWKSWKPEVAGSRNIAGLAVAAFLLVSIYLAFDVLLYSFANERLGWWVPSSPLADPNSLATYFPWMTSLGISLWAGFWEECMFRAIPLACAALIGQRFGGRRYWILGTLLLQAVIFGAGHANYPMQPAYARIIEMIVPFVSFGLIYLAFGLLPVIVMHFVIDVVYISMPLFTVSTPGIWGDRTIVILLTLIPLWVVLRGRWKRGSWSEVAEEYRNGAWQPPPAPVTEAAAQAAPASVGLGGRLRLVLFALGVAGLLAWALASDFKSDAPPIAAGRGEVVAAAREELDDRGIPLGSDWRELSTVSGSLDSVDRFVWQEGGEEAYRELIGNYVEPPRWSVRRARFEGDVVERAEEYRLWFDGDAKLVEFLHVLPEDWPGATLSEEKARAMAHGVLESKYGFDAEALEEVSAEPEQLPARRDWKFVFSDKAGYPLEEGDARIAVEIGGDQVVDSNRFVHVPEEWERAERNRRTLTQLIRIVCTGLMVFIFIAGGITAIVRWSRGRFATGSFVTFAAVLLLLGVVQVANQWPGITSSFSTAQPYTLQAAVAAGGGVIATLMMSAFVALCIGFVHRWVPAQPVEGRGGALIAGGAFGVVVAGILALAGRLAPGNQPTWGPFETAGAAVPLLGAALGPITGWIVMSALLLLVLGFVHAMTHGWTRRRVPMGLLLVVLGLVLGGTAGADSVAVWAGSGVGVGLLLLAGYVLVLRHQLALIPVAAAGAMIFRNLGQGALRVYPGSLVGSIVAALLVGALAVVWFGRMTRDSAAT